MVGDVMSDIDRRRHFPGHEGMEPWVGGEWYHDSAVRELVEALREEHGAAVAPNHGPCEVCELLTHYKDLL